MAAVKTSPQPSEPSSASSPESSVQFPTQKRKGGRKPVYATQEERKMRNRAAQAAFRERRTEYIKHLEATIKHHEEQLSSLQQSSRNAADEVLMLRYKTSLLERILLEKGIDVHSELRAFAQNEASAPPMAPVIAANTNQQRRSAPQQQLHMARSVKRASISHQAPGIYVKTSPVLQATPTSRTSSPTAANSSCMPTPPDQNFLPGSVVSTPASEYLGHQNNHNAISVSNNYYPSPYQTHMEELGKLPPEYEAELLEQDDTPTSGPLDNSTPSHQNNTTVIGGNGNIGVIDMGMNMQAGSPPPSVGGVPQQGLYNVGMPFESLDQIMSNNLRGLTESSISQFNLPFTFATSNLR